MSCGFRTVMDQGCANSYFHTFSDAEWWIYSEGQPTIYWEGHYLAELRLNVNPISYGVLPCLDCLPEGSGLVTVR